VKAHEAERLIETIKSFVDDGKAAPAAGRGAVRPPTSPAVEFQLAELELKAARDGRVLLTTEMLEAIYQRFKNRLLDDLRLDPVFVKLLASQPEIEVLVEPRIVELDASTLRGRVARLIAQGFADGSRATSAFRRELARTGTDPGGGGALSDVLSGFVKDGMLTRDGEGYRKAHNLKITERRLET
jgi:hypothetical protein